MSLNENYEFELGTSPSPIVFHQEELRGHSLAVHENAVSRAKKYLVSEAELLEAIIQVDLDKTYLKFGLTHLTSYCVKHLNLSQDVAALFVRVARKSHQVPELKEAIQDGGLCLSKAKTIASVITPKNHEDWIKSAKTLSKEKLEREVAKASPSSFRAERAKSQGADRVRVEFELSQEEMELFRRCQDLVSQKLGTFATLADTQKELMNCFLNHHDPLRKAERAQARKEKQKASAQAVQKARVEKPAQKNTQPIRNAQANHCIERDKSRDRWGEGHHVDFRSKPASNTKPTSNTKLNSTLRQRPSAAVLHAVNLRDQGQCQARMPDGSLCQQTRWVEHHHIIQVSRGGKHTLENLITLCSSHHRMWHIKDGT